MTIGQRIKEVFDQMPKTCTVAWLASELHCDRRNVYRLFERENVDILLLARLSCIMKHDFFADLSQLLRQSRCMEPENSNNNIQ